MNNWTDQFAGVIEQIPQILLAFLVLILGFIIAAIVARGVRKGLEKTKLDDKLFGQEDGKKKFDSEKIISKIVYYLIVIIAFIWFFNMLNIDMLAEPLSEMLSTITAAFPAILKAALILLVAYVIAIVLKKLIESVGGKSSGMLVKAKAAEDEASARKAVDTLAQIVFYLVLLFALPAVLGALNIESLSQTFTSMLENILNFIPNLIAAALILLIGWFVAKIVRDILTKFLQSIGTDRAAERMNLSKTLKGTSFSEIIGTIVFVLILIPVVISALETLSIEGISDPAISMLNDILSMLPQIAVAVLLILVGVVLGGWAKRIVTGMLERVGFNSLMHKMGLGQAERRTDVPSLSEIAGYVVQIFIIFLFTVEALQVIQLEFLVDLATGVAGYLPAVFAAVVILGIGMWLGEAASRFVKSAIRTPGGDSNVLAAIAKYAILGFALFMALDQLGVADSIINSAFILILGGLALAFGLSFGLGGREKAAKYLEKMDRKMNEMEVEKKSDAADPDRDDFPDNRNDF
ncbi:mechanosensitive ion channel [Salimicrobium flavidum]|uniref:Conserved TM helix n=1 Tax=Salimicrobium flavidum TaxID=570947 RepID=A0A1N7JFD5_9BACI|nr:mechanosensitive ion channel [Salimicrobium flavidum]SIS48018.1 Conserved TM helix [Salimicrobium flavidum]